MRKLELREVLITVDAEPEDADYTTQGYDQELVKAIRAMESESNWGWCCVRVTAHWHGITGCAWLGGASYRDSDDFKSCESYKDLSLEALDDLNKNVEEEMARYETLQRSLEVHQIEMSEHLAHVATAESGAATINYNFSLGKRDTTCVSRFDRFTKSGNAELHVYSRRTPVTVYLANGACTGNYTITPEDVDRLRELYRNGQALLVFGDFTLPFRGKSVHAFVVRKNWCQSPITPLRRTIAAYIAGVCGHKNSYWNWNGAGAGEQPGTVIDLWSLTVLPKFTYENGVLIPSP